MNSIKLAVIYFLLLSISGHAAAGQTCTTKPSSSLIIDVKDKGALGNGIADDTAAIQAAINEITETGGTVYVPSGTYMINAITGIFIKSKITFKMTNYTVLKAIPNNRTNYSIINIKNASNVNLIGGTLIGERDEHIGSSGEWGMGITISRATDVAIEGVTIKNAWGDGFYITGASKNVNVCAVIADNNRRQGMSIISVNGMTVSDSSFKNTRGTAPEAGIIIEPNKGDMVGNVKILNSQFINNNGNGVAIYVANDKQMHVDNIIIDGNHITKNLKEGIAFVNTSGNKITNNIIANNGNDTGIYLTKNTKRNTTTGNRLGGKDKIKDEGENYVSENIIELQGIR